MRVGSADEISCDVLVIGAGVIGLSVAARLSERFSVVVVESHRQFGQETSSRNSEVIHSGIYYPADSKKTEWCIRGRELLYEFCAQFKVPHSKIGKYLISVNEEEDGYLEKMGAHCKSLGVPYEFCGQEQLAASEPIVKARNAIWFPNSGIVDSHALMERLETLLKERGGTLAYQHRVTGIVKHSTGWRTELGGAGGLVLMVASPIVVNAAGLGAAELSNLALSDSGYAHRFCRGRYFGLSPRYVSKLRHLIYPVPPRDGLGIHVTLDLSGAIRLGPDVEWSNIEKYAEVDSLYDCDWKVLEHPFLSAVKRYIPELNASDLSPALIGVRPKLFLRGKESRDFLVENHRGFIHCLGIESPGLTASLAIAEFISDSV